MNPRTWALSPELLPCRVLGAGFCSPRYANVQDALDDHLRQDNGAPTFPLVSGRLRRFTSLLTQMQIDAAGRALQAAAIAPDACVPVFASELGETHTTITLLRGIEDQSVASAARFAQSVHSSAAGLFSIATGNRQPAYALALAECTFWGALLEARLLLAEQPLPVLLCVGDDSLPQVLPSERPGAPLATAFVLAREGGVPLPTPAPGPRPAHLRGSAVIDALHMLLALPS